MKWRREALANRFRYTCGDYRIDGIQKGFGRETFYQLWYCSKRITTEDTLLLAKNAAVIHRESRGGKQ